MLFKMLFVVALLFGVSLAQRPSNLTICDYYALSLYGANTNATQLKLMQSIVSLAYAGGANLPNVPPDLTGIFNPGTFNGTPVALQPWFDGSKESTNLNGAGVATDWLDGGGLAPLEAFLTGQTATVNINSTTNQYRLFGHWFTAFAHIFGCTQPPPAPPSAGGALSLAYVHEFMNLTWTDVGHFIDQLTKASQYFGFSDQDAQTLNGQMNAQYNVRCSPPIITTPGAPEQLFSICQNPTCPLAEQPDCAVYQDLTPSGVVVSSAASSTPSSTTTSSTSSTSTTSTTSFTTSTSATSSATSSSSSSAKLSPGGIAGASIGGAALLFIFVGALVYLLRRRRPNPYVPEPSNPSYTAPSYTDQHTSYNSGIGDHWQGPTIAEMESPRFGGSPEMTQMSPQQLTPPTHLSVPSRLA